MEKDIDKQAGPSQAGIDEEHIIAVEYQCLETFTHGDFVTLDQEKSKGTPPRGLHIVRCVHLQIGTVLIGR